MTFRKRTFRRNRFSTFGKPKYGKGDMIGHFMILRYMGHSDVNKRNNNIMAKPQHWYRCRCSCGQEESRSQQELIDRRRQQMCFICRSDSTTDKKME